ncbi:unnamed protein product [Dicrocoelium dendriticum]|nr:unnamed protein product [Dicrocoelium dendriticum]
MYPGNRSKGPVLALTCQKDSHPFQDRHIVLNDVVKVGRSVARAKPSDTNAIFDCKVLSRSHALIWYNEGRFWLRDTNSSNGTYVNNTRVVKSGDEEFADRELFSGDIIRFGVDVVEHETTHGCIIARVTLFHANGVEAKQNVAPAGVSSGALGIETLHAEQVFRLAHFVGEALFREQLLESKLESMNRLLQETREVSEAGWQAMLNEERLLQKLELYESQLSMLKQDLPPDSLQSHLYQLLEEKVNLEKASEIMLARLLNEKSEVLSKVTNLECCLSDSERECARLRHDCETTQAEYQSVTRHFDAKVLELQQLEEQLKSVQQEKENLQSRLQDRIKEAEALQQSLTAATVLKNRISKPTDSTHLEDLSNEINSSVNGLENGPMESAEQLADMVGTAEELQSSLSKRTDNMRAEVAIAELTELNRLCEIQESLAHSEADLEQVLDSTADGISSHLVDGIRQLHQSLQLIGSLKVLLSQLKSTLFRGLHASNPDSHHHILDTTVNDGNHPNRSTEVTSYSAKSDPESKDQVFSAALFRVTKLTARVAECHARAETSLSSFCALCKRKSASACHTSGDVGSLPETLTDKPAVQPDPDACLTASSSATTALVPCITFPTTPELPGLVDSEVQSSLDEGEVYKLRDELQASLNEAESYKRMVGALQQQDTMKSKLLLSVREECDLLRKRISQVESDVATSREDHQRLIAEARRTRSEADELRGERDALDKQVSACTHRIEQLQAALDDAVRANVNPSPNSCIDLTSLHANASSFEPHSFQSTSLAPASLSRIALGEGSSRSSQSSGNAFSLFAIIPLMIVLCSVMVYIFSKFAR